MGFAPQPLCNVGQKVGTGMEMAVWRVSVRATDVAPGEGSAAGEIFRPVIVNKVLTQFEKMT